MSPIRLLFAVLAMSFVLTACSDKQEKAQNAANTINNLSHEAQVMAPSLVADQSKISSMSKTELVEYRGRLTRYIQICEEVLRLSGTEGVITRGIENARSDLAT